MRIRAVQRASYPSMTLPIHVISRHPTRRGVSANTAELALTNILVAINREHIRYVGLFATDTRDKLFLARLIKTYCPNVHLFSNDNDLLYTHPHFVADMNGMLI